ncbi:ZINC FINGER PROTEIN-LIKE 1 [Salix koriyanagi]|uniref:ZINC FINGER PROTEIN-LIKE 1 n=1 Tax=Salix koriyanagi TaxID=2511006 RepID=A0A9Q0X3E0_9ROSI|nr:ZINC FINGER PROTEIN-LIKE 1 [Salix koriyanagi]
MVVCKCRKATKLYCFVHKVPVCGECICFPEHQICVVRTYSEWVIDGEYDWPPKCCSCQAVLEEGDGPQTTRLGCLHVIHTNCLVSHIKSFPPHTAPAGYVCPSCSTPIWPPKSVKDSGSCFHSKLKEAIMQVVFG